MQRGAPLPNLLRGYLLGLLTFEGLLVLLHFALGENRFFNLDREYNLPSWFSGLQLAAIGAACVAAFHREGAAGRARWLWWVLAAGFCYLSFDEIVVVHERLLRRETLETLPAASFLRGLPPWQIVFAPVALLAALLFATFFTRRFAGVPGCWVPAVAGLGLWGGSFALEGTATAFFMPRGWYQVEVALEELFEMLGGTLILLAVARYAVSIDGVSTRQSAPRWKRRLIWALPLAVFVILPAAATLLVNQRERAAVHQAAGERLLAADRYAEAIEAFNAALDENPDDIAALRGLGTAAYRSGQLDLAAQAFRRAISLAPDDETMRNALDLLRVKRQRAEQRPATPTTAEDPRPARRVP